MGLFSGKSKTTVGTSVMRLVTDKLVPDSTSTGVMKSIMQGGWDDGNISEYVLEDLIQSLGVKAERMYSFAERGRYTHGLPSGTYVSKEQGLEGVDAVLAQLEGQPVTVDYRHFGPANALHVGWMKLIELHGYNPATNQLAGLTAAKGTPVYLDDMVVVVPAAQVAAMEAGALAQWGETPRAGETPTRPATGTAARKLVGTFTPPEISSTATEEHVRVEYVWAGTAPGSASLTIPITALAGYSETAGYFQARYQVAGVTKYWIYRESSGTWPVLDLAYKPARTSGTFFPFVYFRHNKAAEDPASESYKTSKKLVKTLGMDYDQIADGINSNPDIDDVEQAVMMMAVPGNTTNALEQRYLFDFFSAWLSSFPDAPAQHVMTELDASLNRASAWEPVMIIQDGRFRMGLSNGGMYRRRVAGSIGKVGSHASEVVVNTVSIPTSTINEDTGETVEGFTSAKVTSHFYRRQVSTGFYDQIEVQGLRTVFWIYEDYIAIGDDADAILLIPLDHSITETYSIPVREQLYARAMHYVFNSRVVTKIKWYQTPAFRAILIVVMIVITVLSYGSTWEALVAAITAGTVTWAMVVNIIMGILQYLAMMVAMRYFVKVVGAEFAFVVAIVAAVAGVAVGLDVVGGLAGSPWADTLLQLSTGLSKAIGHQVSTELAQLMGEYSQFSEYVAEQTKLLETAKELLDENIHLSPLIIYGETPRQYYERTVHSGNIGNVSVAAISTFVETSLRLPELKDSIQLEGTNE